MPANLDIVYQILHWLKEDKKALRECSLVCRFWLHPSQCLIFKKFVSTIVLDRPYTRYTGRAAIFADSPHLATYVQHVQIYVTSLRICGHLPPLLRRFTNTRSFGITTYSRDQWARVPKDLRCCIEDMVALRTLEQLDLGHWIFNPQQLNDLLKHCSPTLRSLGLWTLDITTSEQEEEVEPVELAGLTELCFDKHTSLPVEGTLKTPNVNTVARLLHSQCSAARCRPLSIPGISAEVSTWSFHINLFECIINERCSAINFDDLVNLRHLSLTIECHFHPANPDPPLHPIISALGRILLRIPTAHLRFLEIYFFCRYDWFEWVQGDWDHMVASLVPFVNAGKLLEKVSFVPIGTTPRNR
ncbi:hypothetical protein CCMSSC00406_0008488 [Pleurotus cornucopiae]|uniref:Uncharacterized protein n=1 Tax=Pleurotus cornucopiae TaxID=5321 RepID=A0ACB7II42_PLECO|nr:hypothetical protein CCMSSC00406_0008488 [Pleurotus cornucopiae]